MLDVNNYSHFITKKSNGDKIKAFVEYTIIGSLSTLTDIVNSSGNYLKNE
ncbi:MAG: hypothetical protein GY756_15860 [bacterium]|nr:hypothetical protein [bacterium]